MTESNVVDLLWAARDRAKQPAPGRPTAPVTVDAAGSAYARAALQREADNVARAGEGTRNDALNRAAFSLGQLVAGGALAEGDVRAALTDAAHACGLDPRETTRTIDSGLSAGREHPRSVPERATDARTPPAGVNPSTGEIAAPGPDSGAVEDFWQARPELTAIRQMARARRTGPWAVLGAALAHVIVQVPPGLTLPPMVGGRASLNLFVGLVGPSGSGKGAADATATAAIDVGDFDRVNTGTGEGIVHAYVRHTKDGLETVRTACLFNVAEIDTLTALAKRQGATIMPLLRSTWSGEQIGFQNADTTRRVHVAAHAYRACLIAGIQPKRADALLADADGGTPQRFMWLPVIDPDAPDIKPDEPLRLTWRMPVWTADDPFNPGQGHLDVAAVITDTVDAERTAVVRGQLDASLAGHDTLARVKVAAALALLAGRTAVTAEDWELSRVLHGVSVRTRTATQAALADAVRQRNRARGKEEAERSQIVAESNREAAVRRVARRVLARLRNGGVMTETEVRRDTAGRDREFVGEALEHLSGAGQIVSCEDEKGRPAWVAQG